MPCCPTCDTEIDVDEFDVDLGDESSCPECGSNLVVTAVAPIALGLSTGAPEDAAGDWPQDDEEQPKPFR